MRTQLLLSLLLLSACNDNTVQSMPPGAATPVEDITLGATVESAVLSAPVDVVRDEWGIPHIYGKNMADVAFAQGYTMAQDRLVLIDLARHQADGTLSELVGDLSPSVIDADVAMRAHHLRTTSEQALMQLQASTDAADVALVKALDNFAAGINAFADDLKAGNVSLPPALSFVYLPSSFKPWTPVDSVLLGNLQAFYLAFDADSDIVRTQIDLAGAMIFDKSLDPVLAARKGIAQDLEILAPVDPTHTIDGWTGMNGDTSTAALDPSDPRNGNLLALLIADRPSVRDLGDDHVLHPQRGSNNWIIGPALSATGHTLVANDTHLSLANPATFYLNHLVTTDDGVDAMGVQFAGIPGIVLGMNRHLAWGATVNNIDVTDVYQETIVACDGTTAPCVVFNGKQVPLVARKETFNIGKYGNISKTKTFTLFDVPHHGPIIPRLNTAHDVEDLGSSELSIRYTGHEVAQILRGVFGVGTAKTMKDAVASLDRDFRYGGQNWVIGDDQGNFGWTQTIRVPRRAKGFAPWKVLPGDGTAEWGADMDPKYIPHAYNPQKGFLATANADPIGVTDDNDPFFDEPEVDGAPLYLGADYDPGTRVGRITKRINAGTTGGKKLSLDDLQSIQADAVSEWAQQLAPTLLDAAKALQAEITTPGAHPEVSSAALGASAFAKSVLPNFIPLFGAWSFDTPSGAAEDNPSQDEIVASQMATIYFAWQSRFADRALGDELAVLKLSPGDGFVQKLLVWMCNQPDKLQTGVSKDTGDAVLFDDLATDKVVEGKQLVAALALLDALDYLQKRLGDDITRWTWGRMHTLTLRFPVEIAALDIPLASEYPDGFPRHGANGTVDVGNFGLDLEDYTYSEGPAIRFVCDVDPAGPHGRNALPGGESFDTSSRHYRDQMELWRKNKTFDLAFTDAEVLDSAKKEFDARASGDKDTNRPNGRVRFQPPSTK